MTDIFTIIGAGVVAIILITLYGFIGLVVYSYGIQKIESIVIWGKKIELNKYGVIICWPIIIAAGILIMAASLFGHLYHTIKKKS